MPLTIGTLIYQPQARFEFNRAYVPHFVVTTGGWPYSFTGFTFRLDVGSPLIFSDFIVFNPKFVVWSSNSYTLDYIVDEVYYTVPGNPTHNPATDVLAWAYHPPGTVTTLFFDLLAVGAPFRKIALPPQPLNWWLPKPLP